jgi:diguanylate cyclase (GGDEF)-like protein/PAS domain S-box-containing protein
MTGPGAYDHPPAVPVASADPGLQHEARYRAFVSSISDMILLLGADGRIRYASPPAERLFGARVNQSPLEALRDFHPDDQPLVLAAFEWLLGHPCLEDEAPEIEPTVVRVHTEHAGWRTLEVRGRNLVADPDIDGILLTLRDITESRQREEHEIASVDLLERLARGAPLLESFNALSELRLGWLPDAFCALGVLDPDGKIRLIPGHGLPPALADLLDAVGATSALGRAARATEQPVVHRDLGGASVWAGLGDQFVAAGIRANWAWTLRDEDGDVIGVLGLFLYEDRGPSRAERLLFAQMAHLAAIIVQRSRVEAAIAHRAMHDALTDLPNRSLLVDRIEQAVALAHRNGGDAAVLFCDLDRFKVVNDSLGHPAGDRLLCGVAQRWQRLLRGGDTVGRFGGDEFLVVANAVGGPSGATALAQRLIAALVEPFEIDGVEVVAGVSIGVALASDEQGASADQLIRAADAAMYEAKGHGGGGFALFEGTMHDGALGRLQLEADLRRAIPGDELVLHYQPIVGVADRSPVAVEALVRWRRPGYGLVFPADFVEVAEETGMIAPLGSWVLREVVRQAAEWTSDPALRRLQISTNLSASHLTKPGLVDEVATLLDDFGVEPSRVGLEVTESALADDPAVVADVIGQLLKLGVPVALDDFGAGFTSMDYARRFATMSSLKIDREFVADLERANGHADAVVAAMVVLGHGLDALVVAEGVETEAQFEMLRALGCDLVQGYLFGRPVPADELASRIAVLDASSRSTG